MESNNLCLTNIILSVEQPFLALKIQYWESLLLFWTDNKLTAWPVFGMEEVFSYSSFSVHNPYNIERRCSAHYWWISLCRWYELQNFMFNSKAAWTNAVIKEWALSFAASMAPLPHGNTRIVQPHTEQVRELIKTHQFNAWGFVGWIVQPG